MNLRATLVAEQARILGKVGTRVDRRRPAVGQFLLNWHYAASGSQTRIRKFRDRSIDQDLFVASGEGTSQVFSELGRGWGYGSLLGRGKDLAASYGLDEISWAPGDVFIDVGANFADLVLYLRSLDERVRDGITYVAIEPGLREAACIRRNVAGIDGHVYQCAASNTDGSAILFYTPRTADSSLLEPPEYDATYEVPTRRLDSLLRENAMSGRRIRLLKVEAEGSELEVLEGAGDMLRNVDWIAADLGFERGLEQRATAPEVIPFLLDNGFRLHKLTQPQVVRYLFANRQMQQ
jgi:FkbM family methyltransferase